MRTLFLALAALLLLAGLAPRAEAEEIFVLEGGSIVRGTMIRETEDKIVVRLSSYYDENTITLRRAEVTKRYLYKEAAGTRPAVASDVNAPAGALPLQGRPGIPHTIVLASAEDLARDGPFDADGSVRYEPSLDAEGFLERLERVVVQSMPTSLEGRLVLGGLLLLMLATLVAGGTRFLGMKAASLQASTTLGFLLGTFLVADTLFHEELLRADRAIWIVPLQAVIWLTVARSSLEAALARTIPLLALMLFAATAFAFAVGSVLVSI